MLSRFLLELPCICLFLKPDRSTCAQRHNATIAMLQCYRSVWNWVSTKHSGIFESLTICLIRPENTITNVSNMAFAKAKLDFFCFCLLSFIISLWLQLLVIPLFIHFLTVSGWPALFQVAIVQYSMRSLNDGNNSHLALSSLLG